MSISPIKESHINYALEFTKKYSISTGLNQNNSPLIGNTKNSARNEKEKNLHNLAKMINNSVKKERRKSMKMDENVMTVLDKIESNKKSNEIVIEGARRKSVLDIEFLPKENVLPSEREKEKVFSERFYDRVKNNIDKVQKKIENKKEQIILEEKSTMKKVQLSKFSQKLIDTKLKELKPIQLRADEIVKNKKSEIEQKKDQLNEKEEAELQAITSRYQITQNFNKEKFDNWVEKNTEWKKHKNSKIIEEKLKNSEMEDLQLKSFFHPIIDKKSEELSKKISGKSCSSKINEKNDFLIKLSKNVKLTDHYFNQEVNLSMPKVKKCSYKLNSSQGNNKNKDKKSRNISADQIYSSEHKMKSNRGVKNNHASFDNRETNISSMNMSYNIPEKFQTKVYRWMKEIHLIDQNKSMKKEEPDNLYKINTQTTSSCNKVKMNKVVLPQKQFQKMVKSFVKTKNN
jgi:hypothetical protein